MAKDDKRLRVEVSGRVQGVGFRPAVYRYARERSLSGWVSNTSEGVVIEVQGPSREVDAFLEALETYPPPRADIRAIGTRVLPLGKDSDFVIRPSKTQDSARTEVSPDLAACPDCLRELSDPSDRRCRYPFLNCTDCGPRFTIVRGVPYDREKTTMASFRMCVDCSSEYKEPMDRRFHAQPTACPACGPKLWLSLPEDDESSALRPVEERPARQVVEEAADMLERGLVVAIKGLGGFHLACDAEDREAVRALRSRKVREGKPFALMAKDAETISRWCRVDEEERRVLESVRSPIVLLRKRELCPLPDETAPGRGELGFLLPYTPLHHMLLDAPGCPRVLVMTSGNLADEPIAHENADAFKRLNKVADAFLMHDRGIETRCDDSVSRVQYGRERLIRRSRGYVPAPVRLPVRLDEPVLACGAGLKNTFCLGKGSDAYLSHHIGDLENLETLGAFEKGVRHFQEIFGVEPAVLACDMHPEYLSTKYAKERGGRLVEVQHHHAHIASCLADNGSGERVIGLAFDGLGYGDDGKAWGGEFLLADLEGSERAAHLAYVPMPGGAAAVREPLRMALSHLYKVYGDDLLTLRIDFARRLDIERFKRLKKMMDTGTNCPETSSMGRLFDAVASLAGIRDEILYEGQAAIELETAAEPCRGSYPLPEPAADGSLDCGPVIRGVVEDLRDGTRPGVVSMRFHRTVAELALRVCRALRRKTGLKTAALSGGVFQNVLLTELTRRRLEEAKFEVLLHRQVPANDGGVSLGQAVVAAGRKG